MHDTIRIVHVVTTLGIGGMENGIVNLCNMHSRDRFNVSVCCLKGTGSMRGRLRPDVQTYDMMLAEGKPIFAPLLLVKWFRRLRPHIVHTHGLAGGSYCGIVGARLAGVPVVINGEHGSFFLRLHQIGLQRILASMCNVTLSVSESLKKQIIHQLGLRAESIHVIRNGVDTKLFSGQHDTAALRRELSDRYGLIIRPSDFVIGSIGSLKPEKNQEMLIKAIPLIRQDTISRKIKVLFVGDGQDMSHLRSFVHDAGLTRQVAFLGERNDIPALLALINLLVSTSIPQHEGLSNVMLEAMSSGVPVIATKSIGAAEIVRVGINGFLAEPNDIEMLAGLIESLTYNSPLLEKMAENSKAFAIKEFSLTKMISEYENIYLNTLRNNKRIWPFSHSV